MQVKKEKITVWLVKTKWNYVGTVRKKIETNYVTQFYIHRTIKGKKKERKQVRKNRPYGRSRPRGASLYIPYIVDQSIKIS